MVFSSLFAAAISAAVSMSRKGSVGPSDGMLDAAYLCCTIWPCDVYLQSIRFWWVLAWLGLLHQHHKLLIGGNVGPPQLACCNGDDEDARYRPWPECLRYLLFTYV